MAVRLNGFVPSRSLFYKGTVYGRGARRTLDQPSRRRALYGNKRRRTTTDPYRPGLGPRGAHTFIMDEPATGPDYGNQIRLLTQILEEEPLSGTAKSAGSR